MARISFNRRNLRNILVLASFASFLLIFLYLAFSEHEDYSSTSTRNPHLDVAVDITNTSNSGSMKLGRYSSRKRRIITIDISQPPPLPAHYLQEAMEERSEVSKFCFAFMTGQQVALGFPAIPYCGPGRKEIATGLGFSESLSFHDKMVRMALIEKGDARLRVAQNKAKAGRKRIEKQLELMAESYGESDDVDEGAEGEPAFDGNQKNRRSLDEASLPEDTASQYPFDPLNQKTGVYSNPDQVVQSPGEAVKLDYVNGTSETPAEPVEGGASRISCKTIDAHIPHTVCDTTNVAISASLLKQSHSKQAQPKFGTVKASCELNETLWFKPHVFGSGAVNWFRGGVDMMDLNKDGIHCDAWVNTPIFAIKRWDTIDPFNIHQDLLNTFIAYASMDIDPSKYQVIVLDDRSPDGPFVSAYTDIFSTSSEFLDMKEITSLSAEGSTVCFKRIVWGFSGQNLGAFIGEQQGDAV
ncbi:hypothetical protein BC829DRAFT_252244 [Chytridium lagenaria]|nr:hypothetical protein BC829DRAFT_252244 [Chytridium lagenaria]